MTADLFVSIDSPVRYDSSSSAETAKPKSFPPRGQCPGDTRLAETTKERERMHAGVRAHATNMEILPNHDGGERRREKVKRFVAEKSPRIAGAAAAIGMFIFNVVTSCA
jgi:hypothetical protein